MAGKYVPLEKHLLGVPKSTHELMLSFHEIEEILHFKLPASAYEDHRWWEHEKEANHINSRAWTNAGWKVQHVDVHQQQVRLVRISQSHVRGA